MSVEPLFAIPDVTADANGAARFATIGRIPISVEIVLGSATMTVAELMAMRRGEIIALDRRVGEPVDIVVNGRIVARGDLQILDDERFGIAITEIVEQSDGTEGVRRDG